MPLTPEELAAKVKKAMENAEDTAGVQRGSIAMAYIAERTSDEPEKTVTKWVEEQAARIKAEQAQKECLFSPAGLRGLFVGLK